MILKGDKDLEFCFHIIISGNRTLFVAGPVVDNYLNGEYLSEISIKMSNIVKKMGYSPRIAFISNSDFGSENNNESIIMRESIDILDKKNVDFEYDGEMSICTALNNNNSLYPFIKLSDYKYKLW